MATRSLTEFYFNFRNIAIQSKSSTSTEFGGYRYSKNGSRSKPVSDDTVALVHSSSDVELGLAGNDEYGGLPPHWVDSMDEVQYDISKIKQRMKDLTVLHDKHLNRPSLDDSVDEEHTIEITTQEITQMFHQCRRSIQNIQAKSKGATKSEQSVVRNVVSSLASSLQDLSQSFKKSQSSYLKTAPQDKLLISLYSEGMVKDFERKLQLNRITTELSKRGLKNREDREKQYFDTGMTTEDSSLFMSEERDMDELYDKGFSTAQLQQVEENSAFIAQREQEITHIVRSITELNEIFKDLGLLIIDQGTILDRIDYNVEQASIEVEKGLEQLQKGEKYQKSSRKMLCIIFLSVALIIMLIVLVVMKAK